MPFKFELPCPICESKKEHPVGLLQGVLTDEDYGLGKCSIHNEHQIYCYLMNPRYEIFIRQGVDSYISGYYLESFMKLYQAIENFRRMFVEASQIWKVEDSTIYDLTRKSLKNSTLLYGAYQYAYFDFFKKVPDTVNSDHSLRSKKINVVKFRNDVIHNGRQPTKSDIETVGQIILNYIQSIEFEYADHINIGDHPVKPVKAGEKTEPLTFHDGLYPKIPDYQGKAMIPIRERIRQKSKLSEYYLVDKDSLLTESFRDKGEVNHKKLTFMGYVKRRKSSTIKDVIIQG